MTARHWGFAGLAIIPAITFAAGCQQTNEFVPPPPPKVTVAQPLTQTIVTFNEFPGQTAATESVEIRARVRGFLETIDFAEGELVEGGELLYTIDPREYQATLDAANAEKASADADFISAEADFVRMERLRQEDQAAELEYINSKAQFDRAKAAVLAAEAAIAKAELDLSFTKITAPIAGRVNRTLVTKGNLVGQSLATLLTTIVPWDPIFVYVTANERDVLRWRKRAEGRNSIPDLPVLLRLTDGTDYPYEGKVDYVDNRINEATGTLQVRAIFENPEGILVPGSFVEARVPSEPIQALLVPQTCIQRDIVGYYVFAVNDKKEAVRHDISVGDQVPPYRVVTEGLTGTERVVVNGMQRVRPGAEVDAQSTELPPLEQPDVGRNRSPIPNSKPIPSTNPSSTETTPDAPASSS